MTEENTPQTEKSSTARELFLSRLTLEEELQFLLSAREFSDPPTSNYASKFAGISRMVSLLRRSFWRLVFVLNAYLHKFQGNFRRAWLVLRTAIDRGHGGSTKQGANGVQSEVSQFQESGESVVDSEQAAKQEIKQTLDRIVGFYYDMACEMSDAIARFSAWGPPRPTKLSEIKDLFQKMYSLVRLFNHRDYLRPSGEIVDLLAAGPEEKRRFRDLLMRKYPKRSDKISSLRSRELDKEILHELTFVVATGFGDPGNLDELCDLLEPFAAYATKIETLPLLGTGEFGQTRDLTQSTPDEKRRFVEGMFSLFSESGGPPPEYDEPLADELIKANISPLRSLAREPRSLDDLLDLIRPFAGHKGIITQHLPEKLYKLSDILCQLSAVKHSLPPELRASITEQVRSAQIGVIRKMDNFLSARLGTPPHGGLK